MSISTWQVSGAGVTHRGKVRQRNEDCLVLDQVYHETEMERPVTFDTSGAAGWIAAVVDGIGGSNAGERASHEVALGLAECQDFTVEGATCRLQDLNIALHQLSLREPRLFGLGAAVAGLLVGSEGVYAFNVGDCRVYRQHERRLALLTTDDTIGEVLIRAGRMSAEGKRPPGTNILTQSIGGRPFPAPIQPHFVPVTLPQCGRFLMCSDGLTDMVQQGVLEAVLVCCDDALAVAELLDAALAAGAKDNVTLAVCTVRREA